jgi:hypothetical protein
MEIACLTVIRCVRPFWYAQPNAISNAIGYAKVFSRSRDAVIRVYDEGAMCSKRTSSMAIS